MPPGTAHRRTSPVLHTSRCRLTPRAAGVERQSGVCSGSQGCEAVGDRGLSRTTRGNWPPDGDGGGAERIPGDHHPRWVILARRAETTASQPSRCATVLPDPWRIRRNH
ncbi:hypothetical protein GCM10022236_49350 [Microlunatus ginsengisoli]|uniref:Uncharacterized protein n=1 Tax=Microlunatus ginsengisoli TaxID=363863 RepID=A0ABP7AVM7_9ACTN